ncbi:MAG: chorismate mutase [Nanoarchaeota archaeon]|nr:chorismate mutase [Nanoarchaeota archaeon]
MEIKDLREKIDLVDKDIINSISKRLELSKDVAKVKYQKNLPIRDNKREVELIKDRTEKLKESGIDDSIFANNLFELIMEKSRQIQEKEILKLKK